MHAQLQATDGGEVGFVSRIARESSLPDIKHAVTWFTSMLGKSSSVFKLRQLLEELGVPTVRTTTFRQGVTLRWGIAWSWYDPCCFLEEGWGFSSRDADLLHRDDDRCQKPPEGSSTTTDREDSLPFRGTTAAAAADTNPHSFTSAASNLFEDALGDELSTTVSPAELVDSPDAVVVSFASPVSALYAADVSIGDDVISCKGAGDSAAGLISLGFVAPGIHRLVVAPSAGQCRQLRELLQPPINEPGVCEGGCESAVTVEVGSKRRREAVDPPVDPLAAHATRAIAASMAPSLSELCVRITDALSAAPPKSSDASSAILSHVASSRFVACGLQCIRAWRGCSVVCSDSGQLSVRFVFEVQILACSNPSASGGRGRAAVAVFLLAAAPGRLPRQAFERFSSGVQRDVLRTGRQWRRKAASQQHSAVQVSSDSAGS
jgi:hypothetical protein